MAEPKVALCGVYVARNTVSGRVYVGSSQNIPTRWRKHIESLRRRDHHSLTFQQSWNKHGENAFVWEVLEEVADPAGLIEREQYWIDTLEACGRETGFNRRARADSNLGMKLSPEACANISAALKGLPKSLEHRAAIAAVRLGSTASDETRANMRAAHAASGKSKEFILAFWSEASAEYREAHGAKISAKNKGRPNPRRSLTTAQIEQARRLKDIGWTYVELSDHYGLDPASLFEAIKGDNYRIPLDQSVTTEVIETDLPDPFNENILTPGTRRRRVNHTVRKMTFEQAEEVRSLSRDGWSFRDLEKRFPVTQACLRDIVSGKTYARP